MTSQRLVEDFARYLFERDHGKPVPSNWRVPDYAMNEAAVFLAGELGQRLQRGERITTADQLEAVPRGALLVDCDGEPMHKISTYTLTGESGEAWTVDEAIEDAAPLTVVWRPEEDDS